MADRNSNQNATRRGDRRPRWSNQPGERDTYYGQQYEQFESGNQSQEYGDSQMGEAGWRTDANRYYGGQGSADRSAERDRGNGATWQNQDRDRGNGYRDVQDQTRQPADFDALGYRSQERSYGSYTGNDFGGRDFSGASSSFRNSAGAYGAAPSTGHGRSHDRGFFERAGDEVASWFGDEDAARRREADHSGRGPGNYTRSDQRILEDVCDRITDDWRVDGTGIQVTVDNGEVTLDGTVTNRDQKRRAEDCVDAISGVKHVQNNLRVERTSEATDEATIKPAPFI